MIYWIKRFTRKHQLRKSNCGRDFGWDIEYENVIIGELTDYEYVDLFWDSYILKSTDKKWDTMLTDHSIWNKCVFKFRNKIFNQYAQGALSSSVSDIVINQRICMRGLYLS